MLAKNKPCISLGLQVPSQKARLDPPQPPQSHLLRFSTTGFVGWDLHGRNIFHVTGAPLSRCPSSGTEFRCGAARRSKVQRRRERSPFHEAQLVALFAEGRASLCFPFKLQSYLRFEGGTGVGLEFGGSSRTEPEEVRLEP